MIVEQTGREALAEMRRLVGVLRRPEEAPALAPQPSLEHLDRLVAQAREAGLPVELKVEGDPVQLAAGLDLTAYRLVQEGLTNALKHAGAEHAEVLVRYDDGHVELTVTDDGKGDGGGESGGHGLVGMRERVSVYGGELEAGPRPEGGYGCTLGCRWRDRDVHLPPHRHRRLDFAGPAVCGTGTATCSPSIIACCAPSSRTPAAKASARRETRSSSPSDARRTPRSRRVAGQQALVGPRLAARSRAARAHGHPHGRRVDHSGRVPRPRGPSSSAHLRRRAGWADPRLAGHARVARGRGTSSFVDLGEQQLKDFERPVRVYRPHVARRDATPRPPAAACASSSSTTRLSSAPASG